MSDSNTPERKKEVEAFIKENITDAYTLFFNSSEMLTVQFNPTASLKDELVVPFSTVEKDPKSLTDKGINQHVINTVNAHVNNIEKIVKEHGNRVTGAQLTIKSDREPEPYTPLD